MYRDEPDVVVGSEHEKRISLGRRRERSVGQRRPGMAVGILIAHERGRVVFRDEDAAPVVALLRAAHEHGCVSGPVALVVVQLERPLDLHLVSLHPVDFGVPAAVLGGTERIGVAVLRRIRIFALVLVEIFAAVVAGRHDGRPRPESGRVVSAPVRLERLADLAGKDVHHGAAYLHGLHVQHVLVRAGVVVGHHHLALQLAVGVQYLRGVVDDKPRNDAVGNHLLHACRRVGVHAVLRGQQLGRAEELHELSGQVDAWRIVGMVGPVDAPRPARARGRDDVRHRRLGAVLRHPCERDRAALRDEHALSGRIEQHPPGIVRHEPVVGGAPVHVRRRLDGVAKIVFRLGALKREARLVRREPHAGLAGHGRGRLGGNAVRRRRDHGHRRIGDVRGKPCVRLRKRRVADFRDAWNAQSETGVCRAQGKRQERRRTQCQKPVLHGSPSPHFTRMM